MTSDIEIYYYSFIQRKTVQLLTSSTCVDAFYTYDLHVFVFRTYVLYVTTNVYMISFFLQISVTDFYTLLKLFAIDLNSIIFCIHFIIFGRFMVFGYVTAYTILINCSINENESFRCFIIILMLS